MPSNIPTTFIQWISFLVDKYGQLFLRGTGVTLLVALTGTVLGFILGLLVAIVRTIPLPRGKWYRQLPMRLVYLLLNVYIEVFRGTPMIVQLFIVFFGLPSLGIVLDAFPAAVITFALNSGAYNAETLRSAILAVPKGQTEAAELVGLTYGQTMRRIILPQAFPIAFPPLFNSLIGMVKDTSLASSITVIELFTKAQQIAARTFEPFVLYLEAAAIYLIFCTVLTLLQKWLEKKMVYRTPDNQMVSAEAEGADAKEEK